MDDNLIELVGMTKRFDKIDEDIHQVKERMQDHMNEDHHVIIERFDDVDEVIAVIKSKLNTKNVGYAGIITTIITLLTVLIGVFK